MKKECKNCLFEEAVGEKKYCHRYPPVFMDSSDLIGDRWDYPEIMEDDWCGDWKPRTSKKQ